MSVLRSEGEIVLKTWLSWKTHVRQNKSTDPGYTHSRVASNFAST